MRTCYALLALLFTPPLFAQASSTDYINQSSSITHHRYRSYTMTFYGTDGVYLRRAGIPTYGLYGLFLRDSDDRSHSSNESLPIDGFYDALGFWYRMMQSASALN